MKKDLQIILGVVILVTVALLLFSTFNKQSKSVSFNGKIATHKIETLGETASLNTESISSDTSTTSQETLPDTTNTYIPPTNTYTPPTYTPPAYIPPTYTPPAQTFTCPNKVSGIADARDMWVWHDNTLIVQAGTQAQNDFFNFVDSHKVKTIYLNLTTSFFNDSTNVSNLKTFLNTAKNSHCLNVEALNGDSGWATDISSATSWAQVVVNFNASISSGNAKLLGLQFDVEPSYDFNSLADQITGNFYINMLEAVRNVLSGSGLLFDVAIPRWYDTKSSLSPLVRNGSNNKSLMQYVLDNADVVTIMDYVSDSTTMYNDAKGELDYASQVGKKVRIGLDATDYISCSQMNNLISSTYNMLTGNKFGAFDGFSIEHYKGANNTLASYSLLCQ